MRRNLTTARELAIAWLLVLLFGFDACDRAQPEHAQARSTHVRRAPYVATDSAGTMLVSSEPTAIGQGGAEETPSGQTPPVSSRGVRERNAHESQPSTEHPPRSVGGTYFARGGATMTFSTKELRSNCVAEPILVVRSLRRKHRLTQAECAAMIGIDATHLKKVETGKRQPGRETQAKLAAFAQRWSKYAELEL